MSKKNKNTKEDINMEETTDNTTTQEKVETKTEEKVEDKIEVEVKEEVVETPEEILQKEKDKYLRLFAEFENYKKRTSKERIELFRTAGKDVIVSIIPVLDDLERGLLEIKKEGNDKILQGVTLISDKLKSILTLKGLEKIEVKAGDTFDAEIHEAITQIPAPTEDMKGKIIDNIEQGYKLGDKIIRFPKVVIGQ